MTPLIASLIAALAFFTATLSGVFGMAGGLILMGGLLLVMPTALAMTTHGLLQAISNGWRAIIWARFIDWPIIGLYAVGASAALVCLIGLSFRPSSVLVYLLLGATALLVWIPKHWLLLDPRRPLHGLVCGFSVSGLQVVAGVAGPLLDVFFVRADMDRRTVVATKALTQTLSHLMKVGFWALPLIPSVLSLGTGKPIPNADDLLPPLWLIALVAPLSMLGTSLGGRFLARMNDVDFRKWTRLIVTGIGGVFLARGLIGLT
jgi:uncharacterized membrane protein YfcA